MAVDNGHVRRGRKRSKGSQRKGVRAGDLLTEMIDRLPEGTNPTVEKSVQLIEGVRIVGADDLTAKDQALYEALLAVARDGGIDADAHSFALRDAMNYLKADRVEQVARSLERLTRTVVRYTFRDERRRTYGSMPLILAEIVEDLEAGTAVVSYVIPAPVKRAALSANSYTWLELHALADFSSRYAARLYQHLAVDAVKDPSVVKPWVVEPLELARMLGYPLEADGSLHYGSFKRRCLVPAMQDIADHVKLFTATWKAERGSGRGRPVTLTFRVTPAEKAFEAHKAARLTYWKGFHDRPDPNHSPEELPSKLAIGRAITATGTDEVTSSNGWRAALDRAKADPRSYVAPGMTGQALLDDLDDRGADMAFGRWIQASKDTPISMDRTAGTAPAQPVMPERERVARQIAQDAVWHLEGWMGDPSRGIPSPWNDDLIRDLCVIYAGPFKSVEHPEAGPDAHAAVPRLSAALAVLRKSSPEHRRSALKTLCEAIAAWDMDRLARVSGGIIGGGPKASPAPARTPPKRTSYFSGTREVTELDTGVDSLYGIEDFDDRDVSDFDPPEPDAYMQPVDED